MQEPAPTAAKATPGDSASRITVEQAETLLRGLGQVISNMGIYGPQHKATRLAVDESFAVLEKMLADRAMVTLGVAEERLLCEGHTIEPQTALLCTLVRRFNATGGGSFGLTRGMTRDEFDRLMQLIGISSEGAAPEGGAFAAAARGGGFAHLSVKKVSYQVVSEDELVVNKAAVTQLAAQAVEGQAAAAAAAVPDAEIIAFLQGQVVAGPSVISKEAAALVSEPAKLAELLLRSADIRPETAQLADGESLGNIVVGCLRRLHQKFSTAPSGKTQQGKKNLGRTLVMLEAEVVEKLRAMSGAAAADAAAAAIGKEVEGLVEGLRSEALAEDYLKKRRLSDTAEQQLVEFIAARQGQAERAALLQELEKKLAGGGLDRAGWEHLLLKGRAAPKAIPADASPLPLLLMRLNELLDPAQHPAAAGGAPPAPVGALVAELHQGVTTVMAGVEQKLDGLRANMATVRTLPAQAKPQEVEAQARARRHIITTLAEIVQELRQPLSVIHGSIEMLYAGHLGVVPASQREMLELALQSSRRLGAIVDTLSVISGMPATLHPDAQVLDVVYHP
jgi:signal transduction histidine kinase